MTNSERERYYKAGIIGLIGALILCAIDSGIRLGKMDVELVRAKAEAESWKGAANRLKLERDLAMVDTD